MFDYNAVNSMVEQVFTDISERGMEGCFERLVCDISADPHRFQTTRQVTSSIPCSIMSNSFNLSACPSSQAFSRPGRCSCRPRRPKLCLPGCLRRCGMARSNGLCVHVKRLSTGTFNLLCIPKVSHT